MIKLTVLPNKDLKLEFVGDEQDKEEIRYQLESFGELVVLAELLEPYTTNGWDFSTADQFGHLSEAPMISDDCVLEDDGSITVYGNVWYFGNYMIESVIGTLLEKGEVIFSNL